MPEEGLPEEGQPGGQSTSKGRSMEGFSADVLREMFRNLQAWESLYEAEGVDVLVSPEGTAWSLWDVKMLYEMSQYYLPVRHAQAIRYCLYHNLSEAQASKEMGAAELMPVSMYASSGLETLVHWSRVGMLPSNSEFRKELAKAQRPKPKLPVYAAISVQSTEAMASWVIKNYVKAQPSLGDAPSGGVIFLPMQHEEGNDAVASC